MKKLTIHTNDTAPTASQPILEEGKKTYGFLPNLFGVFAESPAMVEAYASLSKIFEKADLTHTEQQAVLMTNNRLNDCTYCMAAHTTISKMQGIDDGVIEALRSGSPISDAKLEALRIFTIRINESRGFVGESDIHAFLEAGFSNANILDVILGTGFKALSNYTNHIAQTTLDDAFKPNAWTRTGVAAA